MAERSFSETKQWLHTARTLTEAQPFMRRYAGKSFVIKFGGHAMVNAELAQVFAHDLVLLRQVGIYPIVVHGGGPQIGSMLDRLQIKSEFVDGLRVTDAPTMDVVEMVLAGSINKQIVSAINAAGGSAVGLSGKDAGLIQARRRPPDQPGGRDLGFVGEPHRIEPMVLASLQLAGMIPVIAPIGADESGQTYNINADTAAGAIAAAIDAARLLMLTDVVGVLDTEGTLMPTLTLTDVDRLIADGTVKGGMIPKLRTCADAVRQGVEAAVILDGRVPHGVLLEIFTARGVGTLVKKA